MINAQQDFDQNSDYNTGVENSTGNHSNNFPFRNFKFSFYFLKERFKLLCHLEINSPPEVFNNIQLNLIKESGYQSYVMF